MQCLFDDFFKTYLNAPKEAIDETFENESFCKQKEKLRKAVYSSEYSSILGQLDGKSFSKYYEKVGEFAKAYKIDMRLFTEETPALIEDINEVLCRKPSIAEKLDLINGFTDEELKTDKISFDTKSALIGDLLDCRFVPGDKEQGINRMLMSLTADDRLAFVNKIGTDRKFLNRLILCVNGKEKDELLAVLGEIFIDTGLANEGTCTVIDNGQSDKIEASYNNGRVSITVLQEHGMGARDYRMALKSKYTVDALENISMYYDGSIISVPAILLLLDSKEADNVYDKLLIKNMADDSEIEKIKFLTASGQYRILKSKVDSLIGEDKGKFAKNVRKIIKFLKLDELFLNYSSFMNEDLRDFLNCKEDGTENYTLEEIVNGCGWFEYPSAKAACHQQHHNKTKSGRPLFNAKFGNKDGREVVFKSDFTIVIDYPDKGTYNYVVPEGSFLSKSSREHKKFDINPFYPLMDRLGYESGLITDFLSWGREAIWNETSYLYGYNTEVWDLLQDEKVYGNELMSEKEEFTKLLKHPSYKIFKQQGFKNTGKIYPQNYIDYFLRESEKYE